MQDRRLNVSSEYHDNDNASTSKEVTISHHGDRHPTTPTSVSSKQRSNYTATETEDFQDNASPPKKRKLNEADTRPRSKISPPWKKVAVDGPSSFFKDGRRKSSRNNNLPLELLPQSEKRHTRAAIKGTNTTKGKSDVATAYKVAASPVIQSQHQVNGTRPKSSDHPIKQATNKSSSKASQTQSTDIKTPDTNGAMAKTRSQYRETPVRPSPEASKYRPKPRHTRKATRAPHPVAKEENHKGDQRHVAHQSEDTAPPLADPCVKPQRLKFKVRMPQVTVQHPDHVVRPRRFASFREWLEHDDQLADDDATKYSTEKARQEADIRRRIIEQAQPGGILSKERCSIYRPDEQEEPPRQYTHHDHFVQHAIHFRKLMNREQKFHVVLAKRTAMLCAAEWKRRQPKTKDEVQQEEADAAKARYKQVRKDFLQKWDWITSEVNRRRVERWEDEQQVEGKRALNRVLEQSTQLLDKRRLRGFSAQGSDGGNQSAESEGEDDAKSLGSEQSVSVEGGDDESNMSSSHTESEESLNQVIGDDDESLTIDELRQKYARFSPHSDLDVVQDVEVDEFNAKHVGKSDAEMRDVPFSTESSPVEKTLRSHADKLVDQAATMKLDKVDPALIDDSDVSTDMEDVTEGNDQEPESVDDGDDESESSDYRPGILGFLSKAELDDPGEGSRNFKIAAANTKEEGPDMDMDEVSLVPTTIQVQTPSPSNDEVPSNDSCKESTTPVIQDHNVSDNGSGKGRSVPQIHIRDQSTIQRCSQNRCSEEESAKGARLISLPTTPISSRTLKTPVPSLLRGVLREYQHHGLDWLAGLYANGTNGILADEMGLGKTIQTIALLAHLAVEYEIWGPHLIVVPTSVMLNWEMEFKKFLPGFKILTYYGSQEERKQKRKGWLDDEKWHVCITSYQLVLQDQQTFKRRGWHYMVLDEAHNIKNFRSQRWQTLLTFKTRARLLLTGTPLQNNLTELWSLLFFLMPSDSTKTNIGGFADLQEFSDWFRKPVEQILEHGRETMDDEAKSIVTKLHKVLRPYLLRRMKAEVEKQMPGKYEHVIYCRLSKRQRYLYDGFMSRAQTRETLASGNYLSIINCLMQLRKVCNHPDLFETRQIVTSFAMSKSAVAEYEIKELLVRRRLLQNDPMKQIDLDVVNLLPGGNGPVSALQTIQHRRLGALHTLRSLAAVQHARIDWKMLFDGASVESTLANLENTSRISILEELRHRAYLTSLRSQRRPLYDHSVIERVTLDIMQLPTPRKPCRRSSLADWYSRLSPAMDNMVLNLQRRSEAMQTCIQKFACVTPAAIATDMTSLALTCRGVEMVREANKNCTSDAFHEARMRLSIAFPDKRLLQYDCGKLQRLDKLLRDLHAGGHRALIFTQMTKVLDILEQFLNIHGHRYLRLDGATKIEQRQILTDRFNNDPRILAFILSTRSGGLGINLTGADTVIFYDLDWNPAMDKQCQDRCHRIGQTRDVHIYRFVSEYTIEANILRKANQKRMLDDVVIQEGEFTTDYFSKLHAPDMLGDHALDGDLEANAAMDRVLGGGATSGKVFEQAEDKEDIAAAKVAEKEMVQTDDGDFDEKAAPSSGGGVTPKTPGPATPHDLTLPLASGAAVSPEGAHVTAADSIVRTTSLKAAQSGLVTPDIVQGMQPMPDEEEEPGHIDEYILRFIEWELRDVAVAAAVDKNRKKMKKGGEHRVWRRR